ncbi:MAG: hypothetical protein WC700_07690 [Gemmatimonadaceae bacterium]|jgi:hypothetical protein
MSASFTFNLSQCDRRLADGLRLVGYAIQGGRGEFTADGNHDSATELVFCQIEDEHHKKHLAQFLVSYALARSGPSDEFVDVTKWHVKLVDAATNTMREFDSLKQSDEVANSLAVVLHDDMDSLMNQATVDAAPIKADFTLELTACDRLLAEGVHGVGYKIFGGSGEFTADGNSTRDSAFEEVLCRVHDEAGRAQDLIFRCSYALRCQGHSGGVEEVSAWEVNICGPTFNTSFVQDLTLVQKASAIQVMTEVLRGDEWSFMNRTKARAE